MDKGHAPPIDRQMRRATERVKRKALTQYDLIRDIVLLLQQLQLIEHAQDRKLIDRLRERYGVAL